MAPFSDALDLANRVIQESALTFAGPKFQRYVRRHGKSAGPRNRGGLEKQTGELYSDLWTAYDDRSYYDETLRLLSRRFALNGVPLEWIRGRKCLDAGCGGGRYTVALARLGASQSVGIDIGVGSINDARGRALETGWKNVIFKNGSVLKMPFPGNSFDFVFSNGVLHHTVSPERGFREIYRVLKPGGKMWLHICEKGGFGNTLLNLIRELLKPVPREVTRDWMMLFGFDPQRRFYFMDPWYAPIRVEYSTRQIEAVLRKHGFKNIRRLVRDISDNHYVGTNEMLFRRIPHADFWFGDGKHRYVAEK